MHVWHAQGLGSRRAQPFPPRAVVSVAEVCFLTLGSSTSLPLGSRLRSIAVLSSEVASAHKDCRPPPRCRRSGTQGA